MVLKAPVHVAPDARWQLNYFGKTLGLYVLLAACVVTSCEHRERFDASRAAQRAAAQQLIVAAGADEFGLRLNKNRLGMYPLNAAICEPLVKLTNDFQLERAS